MFNPKKILAASMLAILTAPIFFLVVFFIKQLHIQQEMKEKLESASLQTIALKRSDFTWVRKNKEIVIDGKLFDIKSIVINKNEIIVTGLFDDDENKLEEMFSSVIYQKKKQAAPINKLILKFILTPVFIRSQVAIIAWLGQNPLSLFGYYDEVLINRSYAIKTPPPIT